MSDYMAAEIHIGGKLPRPAAEALCKLIGDSRACLEWGGGVCRLKTSQDLLAAASADGEGLLKLYDDEARWGEFEDLETFLRTHSIPYCRWSEGKYEQDPQAVAFHAQSGLRQWQTNHERKAMVPGSQLTPILAKLDSLLQSLKRGEVAAADVLTHIEDLHSSLQAALPPEEPSLEALAIVDDGP